MLSAHDDDLVAPACEAFDAIIFHPCYHQWVVPNARASAHCTKEKGDPFQAKVIILTHDRWTEDGGKGHVATLIHYCLDLRNSGVASGVKRMTVTTLRPSVGYAKRAGEARRKPLAGKGGLSRQ